MKLFHWDRAESLENYASGDIIVMAEDLEAARKIAMEEFEKYLQFDESSSMKWMFDMNGPDVSLWEDEDDRERYTEKVHTFKMDIAAQPEEKTAVFVRGSD